MDRSHGFGSMTSNFRPIKTRFLYGSGTLYFNLARYHNSLARSTKSTRSWLLPVSLLVNIRFQFLFHSPPGVLFTFPSRYLFAIGHQVVFSLGGWSPHFPTRFLVSRGTLLCRYFFAFVYRTVTFFGSSSQMILLAIYTLCTVGLYPVRSPLLGISSFLSFPQVT